MPNEPEQWIWDAALGRYRNARTKRLVPLDKVRKLRDGLLDAAVVLVRSLADQLAERKLSLDAWQAGMQAAIKSVFGAEYALGRGGLNAMQPDDWQRLGQMLDEQYGYLERFAEDIAAAKLSQPQIRVRVELYVGSSVQAHEAGKAAAFDVELPAQPGDWSSECGSSDRCHWFVRRRKDGKVEATWVANIDKRTCKTCRKRAKDWNPLVLTPGERAAAEVPTSSRLRTPSVVRV